MNVELRGRRLDAACVAFFALVALTSVWPILSSGSIPAFQQDWAWPLSRELDLQWLYSFFGLWDPRSLGHANALPWQTFVVAAQAGIVLAFGPSLGLALIVALLEFAAAMSCALLLDRFGVTSRAARTIAATLYAFGPVVYTRIAAGHLAYLLAYALLPLAVAYGRRAIEERAWIPAVLLGLTIGFAASQIQFLAIAWLAVLPLAVAVTRAPGWVWRLLLAACVAIALQLQALLPLLAGSTQSLYSAERALLSWEYNNSSPFASALIGLGYFTQYYESHALPWTPIVLYVLLGAAVLLGIFARRRSGAYATILIALGAIFTAGLYGPLSGTLIWAFERSTYATAFRDLHYFAVLTALGVAIGLGLAMQRVRPAAIVFALPVAWVVFPAAIGAELSSLLVPPRYVADALATMHAIELRGPGRVLWLPAEEPVGLVGSANVGRDFIAYGPGANPSVSDNFQNPQIAYALAMLRDGTPDWNALRAIGIRFVVYRRYVRSGRKEDNLGTGFQLAYGKLGDAQL
ncbi:MAG TPA: hypothetical protein VKR05_00180, partial [Candidatus Cybelea sp.]|nr:hypothetical protein [Candidatus Cybelea sp.]